MFKILLNQGKIKKKFIYFIYLLWIMYSKLWKFRPEPDQNGMKNELNSR